MSSPVRCVIEEFRYRSHTIPGLRNVTLRRAGMIMPPYPLQTDKSP